MRQSDTQRHQRESWKARCCQELRSWGLAVLWSAPCWGLFLASRWTDGWWSGVCFAGFLLVSVAFIVVGLRWEQLAWREFFEADEFQADEFQAHEFQGDEFVDSHWVHDDGDSEEARSS